MKKERYKFSWSGLVTMQTTLFLGQGKSMLLYDEIQQIKTFIISEFERSHPELTYPDTKD
ncbi:MAG: hypothetical protein LUC45_02890 [Paraprevotella sp.]|nr:hypothetical protein [Paraprevotella sp.]